jgi:Zn-dependent alcohol dehydrogenase
VAAFAETVVIGATGAVKIPDDVPLDVACVVGCAVQTGVGRRGPGAGFGGLSILTR